MSKILVDAVHPEETRLVVCDKVGIEEFEYQNAEKQSIKGNIYLAKTTRVEPSLQAVFVDYGQGNDGFLPLSEINPEYFQIPVADKEKLREAMMEHGYDDEDMDEDSDAQQERKNAELYRQYKIQEVIKVGQVMLVQVKKEGRGKKGATLTTYISLAGRYCVLMPNAVNVGGVSRKIADESERQRLRKALASMKDKIIGQAASVIVRTAGEHKTKVELKRDLTYLTSLWNKIREHTLASTAPAFIYEERDVIQKVIRDIYSSEIEEILIEGKEAYEHAKAFMGMLLPKHLNKIKLYEGTTPIFSKFNNIERQLGSLYDNIVQLKSGGYLVINQTEALVAIDVNSGRANKERDIERTATKINLEAAKEVARQLRLRDLSGLIVIDFIDMEETKNKRSVESAFKEAISSDKAKINVTKISNLGMLEISRQRLRPNFWEVNTYSCEHCQGRGRIRHVAATSVAILRAIANEVAGATFAELKVTASAAVVLNTLNTKRSFIADLEKQSGVTITFHIDEEAGPDGFFLEKTKAKAKSASTISPVDMSVDMRDDASLDAVDEADEQEDNEEFVQPMKAKRTRRKWNEGKGRKDKVEGANSDTRDKQEDEIEVMEGEESHETGYYDSEDGAQEGDNRRQGGRSRRRITGQRQQRSEGLDSDRNMEQESNGRDREQHDDRGARRGRGRRRQGQQRGDHERDTTSGPRGGQRQGGDRKRGAYSDMKAEDVSREADRFDQEMNELRKKNESFLKEMWKKITD